ncbi:DUF2309 domain-containing protein [Solemya pervernicosa gill symbiont]|uniref:Probable inorganic carbon transporter subunit DabA n=1 Tax=Solemya pervernicosa gill symbiont TaxID=642797 RepID=A0A1T2L0N5_9GAMM|nr:DUF2309 domain-containing protein [Solemya pervernicosa gill symbiont]
MEEIRERLNHAIEHFEHVLPGQAPIKDFVHHNTLHGYEKLPFPDALAAVEENSGVHGYLPIEQFRKFYKQGRINRTDLQQILNESPELNADEVLFQSTSGPVSRGEITIAALVNPLNRLTGCQLNWKIEEQDALHSFQDDVSDKRRQRLLKAAAEKGFNGEADAINDLWGACLEGLGLEYYILHPEELIDLSPEDAERILTSLSGEESGEEHSHHHRAQQHSKELLSELLERAGSDLTLRGVLKAVTGIDLLDELRPTLVRYLAAYLDQGMAAWHNIDRSEGFYAAWRNSAANDLGWLFDDLPEWRDELDFLPEDPLETIIIELRRLGLEASKWERYLELLSLEIPGWSGMFLWRHLNPGYEGLDTKVEMIDYLAVRLILERLFAQRICRKQWQLEASFDVLRWYFQRRSSEFLIRYALFNSHLPEYLITQAQRQIERAHSETENYAPWQQLADMIWTWQQSPAADRPDSYTVQHHAWQLFRIAQHLGLCGDEIRTLNTAQLDAMFDLLDELSDNRAGFIWLRAYERHYREQVFNAIAANHGRGRRAVREQRPSAQVIFCMDDREEGIRRHIEELAPSVETMGAAAHFNVFNFWHGLDDEKPSVLCPVVAVPTHDVREVAKPEHQPLAESHSQRRSLRLKIKSLLAQSTQRNIFSSALLITAAAPAALLTLIGKSIAPFGFGRAVEKSRQSFEQERIDTRIQFTATEAKSDATPEAPQQGFTDSEQADRAEAFLKNIGLLSDHSPLPVIMGHGSISQNNPHLAAYDCGACSGRHSGPNARILAAMINRPEVRALLVERGITIPDDTWFIGAEHNTCNEEIIWYDADIIPEALQKKFTTLQAQLLEASEKSAHERCRRLASAPDNPSLKQAYRHIAGRATDFSQARPELGHATNASALIGRRSVTQGAFFDRRIFLISYDPTTDESGAVLERLLLANGPVGAGISLEYYFSTVNNEEYGSGSKVTHNVSGLLGVMDGTSGDLRTGLPRQMIEIHEAMRLLVICEATTEMLTEIYKRQPPIQELVGNGWLLLAAKDPDSGTIHSFDPSQGWIEWEGDQPPLTTVKRSPDWYNGHSEPLTPALIEQQEVANA